MLCHSLKFYNNVQNITSFVFLCSFVRNRSRERHERQCQRMQNTKDTSNKMFWASLPNRSVLLCAKPTNSCETKVVAKIELGVMQVYILCNRLDEFEYFVNAFQ